MLIKICGLKHVDNMIQIAESIPDFVGLIFYKKSPRYFEGTSPALPTNVKKTGVWVNPTMEDLTEKVDSNDLNAIQLHGKESIELLKEIREKWPHILLIKALSCDSELTQQTICMYEDYIDYLLFDTPTIQHGGSGKTFDWKLLNRFEFKKPYFLSGGLDIDSLKSIEHLNTQPAGLDFNSKLEISPGLKDIEKTTTLIQHIRNENNLYNP